MFLNTVQKRLLFNNEPSQELWGILCVYFVQGILGLARLAISFFLKDELGLNPAQVAALTGIAVIPWIIKPLFGFLSDAFPLLGYRRRSYLFLSGIVGTMGWLALATVVKQPWSAAGAMLLISVSVAIADVIADSLVVERARSQSNADVGSLQSLTWATAAVGSLITAYLSGWLLERLTTQAIFGITAIFPLLVSAIAGLISEQPTAKTPQPQLEIIKDSGAKLLSAIRQRSIWLPTAFIFIWQSTPNGEAAFFFFLTNELDFQPEFLGRVRLVTSIATLLGIWLYQRYFKEIPFRVILGWTSALSAIIGLSALLLVTHTNRVIGISDHWFSLGDSLILTVTGQIAFMPILVLSARLCPAGVEATLFALLMSVLNLSGFLSNELGALLTHVLGITESNFDNLWLLLLITNFSNLLPLPFLGWLPSDKVQWENNPVLPPAELWEHGHNTGFVEQSFLPDVFPELINSTKKS